MNSRSTPVRAAARPEGIEDDVKESFRRAMENRNWRSHQDELLEAYNSTVDSRQGLIGGLKQIILRVMVIPQHQSRNADQLMTVFNKVYAIFQRNCEKRQISHEDDDQRRNVAKQEVYEVFHEHMETAFKLTQHKEPLVIQRAFQWLLAIVEAAPIQFWREVQKRIIKSIFTHCVYNALIGNPKIKNEGFRINAIRIAGKFQEISKSKGYDEYLKIIRNHLIKVMMEDRKENFRIEAVKQIYLGTGQDEDDDLGLKLFCMKTLDKSVKVRRAVYRRLLHFGSKSKGPFELTCFCEEDRIQLILNGLKDPDSQVLLLCKQYLAGQICAKP